MSHFLSDRALGEVNAGGAAKLWAEVVTLAQRPDIKVDLGQGYPDFQADAAALAACSSALATPKLNQYAPIPGAPTLVAAVASWYHCEAANVVVTTSGTEAIYASCQAFINKGDEVIVFEPMFPWYIPSIRLAGGTPVVLTLKAEDGFAVDSVALRGAFSERTKMVIVNSPHNPTGHVASAAELQAVVDIAIEFDVLVLSDEVYEPFTFGGRKNVRTASLPGAAQRTVTLGSAGKLFSLTGWRVGWAVSANAELVKAVKTIHAYTTYSAATPCQEGVAAALQAAADNGGVDHEGFVALRTAFEANAAVLAGALGRLGATSFPAEGGYFLVADVAGTGMTDLEFCTFLATEVKVVAVPLSVFYDGDMSERRTLVRFAVCKRKETIAAVSAAVDAYLQARGSSGGGAESAATLSPAAPPAVPRSAWPAAVGKSGEVAKADILSERPELTVHVIPADGMMTCDFVESRVRIMVDASGKVSSPPKCG